MIRFPRWARRAAEKRRRQAERRQVRYLAWLAIDAATRGGYENPYA